MPDTSAILIPDEVGYIIETLEKHGFEAYTVGGCVRDSLMGNQPKDWDICTSALPEQTKECFKSFHIIETGLKHGTITLRVNHKPFEITTYRIDGEYRDNRRPESVEFVKSLKQDLSRRDFTINAIAYNPTKGIIDFYNGASDISAGVIKCVGDPDKRFSEDALRIMRALRFACELRFKIDKDTSAAMSGNRKLLHNIAAERIADELNRMIVCGGVGGIISEYLDVMAEIIPEIKPMVGFKQNTPYHCYDVFEHTMKSIDAAPFDVQIRLTMLFHDIAKPLHYTELNGVGHFYGHSQTSSGMAKKILRRLKYDNNTVDTVSLLILYHDSKINPDRLSLKRWLNKIGEERLRQLFEVKRADANAQAEQYRSGKLSGLDEAVRITDAIISERQCFALKDLAVNGRDMIDAGVTEGPDIRFMLNKLLDMVINEQIENTKESLLAAVKDIHATIG